MSPPADNVVLFKSWLEDHRGIMVKVARSFAPAPVDGAELQQEIRSIEPRLAELEKLRHDLLSPE